MSQGAFEPFLLLCVQVNELAVDYHLKRRELGQSVPGQVDVARQVFFSVRSILVVVGGGSGGLLVVLLMNVVVMLSRVPLHAAPEGRGT